MKNIFFPHTCLASISIIISLLMFFVSNINATTIENFEEKIKKKQIPGFCRCVQTAPNMNLVKYKEYVKKFGFSWTHMHHYCYAIDEYNMAFILEKKHYRNYLTYAIGDLDYILRNAEPNFVFLPQILLKKGQILILLGKDLEGVQCFQMAIKKNNKFVPAYLALADSLLKIGGKETAIKVLRSGLKINSTSTALKKKMFEISGSKTN